MKIYTKQGDQGRTRLVGGSQVAKSHERVEAYGNVDELNAVIGLVISASRREKNNSGLKKMMEVLLALQSELFVVGGILACEDPNTLKKLPQLSAASVELLEKQIDEMDLKLEPLKNFILPGGHEVANFLHLARTVCRRAERTCVALSLQTESSSQELGLCITYLNRLSDYLFTAARFANLQLGEKDQLWVHS